MKKDTQKAASLLKNSGYTCVICSGDAMLSSVKRGVKPLLEWIDDGVSLKGYCAADKVVGKAAAFLYILLGVDEVYAAVMSEPARQTLEHFGISTYAENVVELIENRTKTGYCPMETAVLELSEPSEALAAVRSKLRELRQ